MMGTVDQRRLAACKTRKQKVVELYRQGRQHDEIVTTLNRPLDEIRKIISAATADDTGLYQEHKTGRHD